MLIWSSERNAEEAQNENEKNLRSDIDEDGYTFISCATTPKFTYDGFHLVDKAELQDTYPDLADELGYLAYE